MPETTEKLIQLTETQLKALLAEAASGAGVLPPGAFRENGRVWRHVWVPAQGTDPKTGQPRAGRRRVKRPVYITSDMSPEGLLAAKRAAYRSAPPMDFWHPDHGWLRNGSKREVDHPANIGHESDDSDVVYDEVEELPAPAAPAAPPEDVVPAGDDGRATQWPEPEAPPDVVPEGDDIRAPQGTESDPDTQREPARATRKA